jgi:hypothetical protein
MMYRTMLAASWEKVSDPIACPPHKGLQEGRKSEYTNEV